MLDGGSGDGFLSTVWGKGEVQGGDPPPGLRGSGLVALPVFLREHKRPLSMSLRGRANAASPKFKGKRHDERQWPPGGAQSPR